jgi:hypothetical protein
VDSRKTRVGFDSKRETFEILDRQQLIKPKTENATVRKSNLSPSNISIESVN